MACRFVVFFMKPIQQQKILAVETCTMACSVALWDGKRMYERFLEAERSHSKKLLPMCQSVLSEAGLTMSHVDAIACTRGPGSFTGVRIGVGVAKGLAFGQNLPIYAVSSLAALAYQVMEVAPCERVVALLDARMGELYMGEYENAHGFPRLIGQESLTDVASLTVEQQLFAGTGAHEYADALKARGATLSPVLFPNARGVVALVQRGDVKAVGASALTPIYLRNKVTH